MNAKKTDSTEAPLAKPHIIFEPTVFARDTLLENWPHLDKVIATGDQLAAAFKAITKSPAWRSDPRLRNVDPETAEEVLELYNDVIDDGNYVAEFLSKPRDVARKLGHRPSKKAIDVILAAGRSNDNVAAVVGAAVVISVAVVGVAVTTAIVSSNVDIRHRILIDESGRVKLGNERLKSKGKTKTKKHA
jgi:hypothetical protein